MALQPGSVLGSRRLGLLLLAVIALPAATLIALGLQLLAQDRTLMAQRAVEQRLIAVQTVARALDQRLALIERSKVSDPLPAGSVRITITANRIHLEPRENVLWTPQAPSVPEAPAAPFEAAERDEFRGNLAAASTVYRTLAASRDPAVKVGALMRAARLSRKVSRWDDALQFYGVVASMPTVAFAGLPADLVARRASLDVLADASRVGDRIVAARALEADLLSGRWTVDRASWDLIVADLERALGRPASTPVERRTLSLVADRLWAESGDHPRSPDSRRLVEAEGRWTAIVGRETGEGVTWVAIPASVVAGWAKEAAAASPVFAGPLTLLTETGASFAGPPMAKGAITLPAMDAGLPWALALNPESARPDTQTIAGRRALLTMGLVAILMLFGGGSYFLWRVVQRELDVARQQAEFVSAVSHEFRTPLTTLRHVTELLTENDGLPHDQRRAFYEALHRNTVRLQRLVESLLDFARMESGRRPYSRERLDVGTLLTRIVSDFSADAASRGVAVRLHVDPSASATVLADAASLTTGIWNLLDNAVKYSVNGGEVDVSLTRRGALVAIAVRDRGIGIPPGEQSQIFERFVRGRQATALGIKGTGLGLAMVSHVIRAHDGVIELESAEGTGSTFTIVLPHEAPVGAHP